MLRDVLTFIGPPKKADDFNNGHIKNQKWCPVIVEIKTLYS